MPGITPEELANLLDSGLDSNEISYLCFMRWRFRRGDLNEGLTLGNQLASNSLTRGRAPRAALDRSRV